MVKLKLNREFLLRHLFSLAVFLALGGWFAYDAFVKYPATPARDLYVAIEKSEPHESFDLEAFKIQKTGTQRILAGAALLAAFCIGAHLFAVSRFTFEFDEGGFTVGSKRFSYGDIKNVDTSKWAKKSILVISGEGWKTSLDAWHHEGVKDFYEKLTSGVDSSVKI